MFSYGFGRLPSKGILICTILTFAVPYMVNSMNKKIHEWGDPPWKKEDRKNNEKNQE